MKKKIMYAIVVAYVAVAGIRQLSFSSNEYSIIQMENLIKNAYAEEEGEIDCCIDPGDICIVGGTRVPDYDEC